MADAVEALDRALARILGERLLAGARDHDLGGAMGGRAAEHHEVDQGVAAQTVGAVDRGAAGLADRHQARDDLVGAAAVEPSDHLGRVVGRDAAHVVMAGWHHRDRLPRDVDAGEDLGGLRDAGQALVEQRRVEVLEVQLDVVLARPAAAALVDLDGHRAAHHVARGEVLGGRRVALHEALTVSVGEVAALAAGTLGDQAAGAVDPRRVELDELHVLQRQARRAAPSRCRRPCRYAPRCRRSRPGRSRRSRAP